MPDRLTDTEGTGGMDFVAWQFRIAVAMYGRHTFHAAAIAEGQTLQIMASGNMPSDAFDPDCAALGCPRF